MQGPKNGKLHAARPQQRHKRPEKDGASCWTGYLHKDSFYYLTCPEIHSEQLQWASTWGHNNLLWMKQLAHGALGRDLGGITRLVM